jgi:predicted ribosome quality control (RQC) complex YloA/Tae2 family protein
MNYFIQMKLETFEYDGIIYTIKIGRSAIENTELVKNASKSDIWFHLSDSPSCHVVLTCETKLNQVPRQVISRCAYLCKMHSKTLAKSKVIYTQIENVQTTRIAGQVVTTHCKTI